jgi:hypothetical protein
MTILESFKPKHDGKPRERMSRGSPMPVAQHEQYADEAARAAQRYMEQVVQIETLVTDLDHWRNRAALAESQVEALKARERELQHQIDEALHSRASEVDRLKQSIAVISSHYAAAAKLILEGFDVISGNSDMQVKLVKPVLPPLIEEQQESQS